MIGRSAECAVCIDDALTSRRHAALTVLPDGLSVTDLGSRNGVLLNGEILSSARAVCEGDIITVGAKPIVLLQIDRRGSGSSKETPRRVAAQRPPETTTVGKIVLVQRTASEDEAIDASLAVALRLAESTVQLPGAVQAFRVLGQAATQAISDGNAAKAEGILERPLTGLMASLRAGLVPDRTLVNIASHQALALAYATCKRAWIAYVFDLYTATGLSIPPNIADRIATAVGKVK